MRPLVIVVGLAFAATVLITDLGAIMCYDGKGDDQKRWSKKTCNATTTQCFIMPFGRQVMRKCDSRKICNRPRKGTTCCSKDYCNGITKSSGDVTSTPPVSLLVAVVVSAIAALGV